MSDPYASDWMGQVEPTVGPQAGFWDNVGASFDHARHVSTTLAIPADVSEEWNNSLRAYRDRTGEDPFGQLDTSYRGVENFLASVDHRFSARTDDSANEAQQLFTSQQLAKAQEINAKIAALKDPNIKPIEAILEQVLKQREEIIAESNEVSSRSSGFNSTVGGFVGGFAGALANLPRHPEQLPFFQAGGFGRTAAQRILTEGLVVGGMQYGAEVADIQPTQRALGEQEDDALAAAFQAALIGVVFRGGLEGVGKLAGKYLRPEDFAGPEVKLDFEDAQLKSMFESRPLDPNFRAGNELVNNQIRFDTHNPYGDTTVGARRFTGEVDEVLALVEGRTATAVARFLPNTQEFTFENQDFHTQVVREQKPIVYAAAEATRKTVEDIDAKLATVTQQLHGLTIGDAIREAGAPNAAKLAELGARVNDPNLTSLQRNKAAREMAKLEAEAKFGGLKQVPEDVQARINELEARLSEPALERHGKIARGWVKELDELVKSVGERPLESAMGRLEGPLREQLAALNAARVPAAKAARRAQTVLAREIARVKAEENVVLAVAKAAPKSHPYAALFDHPASETVAARADAAVKTLDDDAEALANSWLGKGEAAHKEPIEGEGEVKPEPNITLADGTKLDLDFEIEHPDKPGKTITLRALLRDLEADEALVEATRICAL